MADGVLLSPTFSSTVGNPMIPGGGGGFDRMKKTIVRKTVDYHCSVLRYLENRVWQRDVRDRPIIQPDTSYFNEVVVPQGLDEHSVNAATTKFVKACTNKARSPIFCTTWVPDGRRLVTGAASGEFTLWNGINFNFESIIQAHDCSVRSMNWSHSGKWMVTTDDRGFVKYWQINFNNVHTFQAHSEPVRSSSFSPNDSKLATCSDDGTIRIFDFLSCTEEHLLRGHGADVKCIHWHPIKSLLISGSKDNQQPVKLWDPKAGQSVCTIHAHKATVMDVKWNPNGNWFGTASRDHLIKIYDIRMMKELWVLKGHKKDVNTISWHPIHEKFFTSGGSDGAILFWSMGIGREVGGMESAHEGFVWSLSWHPLGHLLCSGANDHTCKFWCRNRPGEEIRDKYNTFHNPFFGGEDDYSINLPGMVNQGGVALPPPSSRLTNAVNLPPPSLANTWKPSNDNFGGEPPLGSPQLNVPVLGADIIAQTFSAPRKPIDIPNDNNQVSFGMADETGDNHRSRDFEGNRTPMGPLHGSFADSPRPGFKGHPLHEDRPGFNNPFTWRNPDMMSAPPPSSHHRDPFEQQQSPEFHDAHSHHGPPLLPDPRGGGPPPHDYPSHDQRGPPPPFHDHHHNFPSPRDHEFRGIDDPRGHDHPSHRGAPPTSHDLRGPPQTGHRRGLPPSHDARGPGNDHPSHRGGPPQPDHDRPPHRGGPPDSRGPPDPRGPPQLDHDRPSHRGGPPDLRGGPPDPRGPPKPDHDRPPHRGGPPDPRGPPQPDHDRLPHRGGPPDPRGPPQPDHDRPPHRGGPPDPRGPPQPDHDRPPHRGGPPDPRGPPQPDHDRPPHRGGPPDPRGPPQPDHDHPPHRGGPDPRGGPPDPRGPLQLDHNRPPHRGGPPDPRGGPPDLRGPPQPDHDRPPHRGGPPDPRGGPPDPRGLPQPDHDRPSHRGGPPPMPHDPRREGGPPPFIKHDGEGHNDTRGPPHDPRGGNVHHHGGPPTSHHDMRGPHPHDMRRGPPPHDRRDLMPDPREPDFHRPPPNHFEDNQYNQDRHPPLGFNHEFQNAEGFGDPRFERRGGGDKKWRGDRPRRSSIDPPVPPLKRPRN